MFTREKNVIILINARSVSPIKHSFCIPYSCDMCGKSYEYRSDEGGYKIKSTESSSLENETTSAPEDCGEAKIQEIKQKSKKKDKISSDSTCPLLSKDVLHVKIGQKMWELCKL